VPLAALLALALAILGHVPPAAPAVIRARLIGRLTGRVARLEASRRRRPLSDGQAARLARLRAVLRELRG
jgi:hypothetical protein